MTIRLLELTSAQQWSDLESFLGAAQGNADITANIVRHLRELSARSALIDDDYIDRDFSEAFSAYYAKTFKRHSKVCKRILFFSCDLSFLSSESVDVAARRLEGLNASFLGWIVLRPISKAPVSQAILRPPPAPPGYERHLLVRAGYTAHILGAELSVEAVPMTQQDSRVGACAQASIWVSARHIHARHRGPWLSTVSITDAAIARSESQINTTLPAGSEFLTVNNTVAAFRAADREPLIYAANIGSSGALQWGSLRPQEIINRYVDSGIPVSIWLKSPNSSISHSIVATGQVLSAKAPAALPSRPTRAEYCAAFLVNDDQQGPNLRLSSTPSSPIAELAAHNVQDNTVVLIIPLPSKVYLPAETAETLAWAILDLYVADWQSHKANNVGALGASEALGDQFVSAHSSNTIVGRTYLTYGWKYKHRAIRNNLNANLKKIVRDLDLPRYVYVTEFSLTSQLDDKALAERRILAHVVVDATAKHHDFEAVLFFHAPGLSLWHSHGQNNDLVRYVAASADDTEYFPKVRGDVDFASFYAAQTP
jgi:hypothetical protein